MHIITQKIDQHGDYVRLWCPELKNVPNEFVHTPWKMTYFHQQQYNCQLGVHYPNPIVPPTQPQYNDNNNNNNNNKNSYSKSSNSKHSRNTASNNQRKPNRQNRHEKYEMKSLKQGTYRINDS
jgi:deoxyribodipyrimidine photo-lyase